MNTLSPLSHTTTQNIDRLKAAATAAELTSVAAPANSPTIKVIQLPIVPLLISDLSAPHTL